MKAKIIAALMIACLIPTHSQGQDSGSRAKRKLLAWRTEVLASVREPYRKVNGKAYDLNPFFAYEKRMVEDPDFAESPPPLAQEWVNWQILFGTVLQDLKKDGILLRQYLDPELEGESHIARLKNFPRQTALVDGDNLTVFAYADGRYSYLNTSGARSTVSSYDYGEVLAGEELDKFKEKLQAESAARRQTLQKLRVQQQENQNEKRQQASRKVAEHYSQKATNGDGFAQLRLGEIYLHGEGAHTNFDLARHWLSSALTNGYPQATNLLNEIPLQSHPVQP